MVLLAAICSGDRGRGDRESGDSRDGCGDRRDERLSASGRDGTLRWRRDGRCCAREAADSLHSSQGVVPDGFRDLPQNCSMHR